MIFAYTVKGHGLATEGHPQNHSSLLTAAQFAQLAERLGTDPDDPWAPFPDGSAEARCAQSVGPGCAATRCRSRAARRPDRLRSHAVTAPRPPRRRWGARCST